MVRNPDGKVDSVRRVIGKVGVSKIKGGMCELRTARRLRRSYLEYTITSSRKKQALTSVKAVDLLK